MADVAREPIPTDQSLMSKHSTDQRSPPLVRSPGKVSRPHERYIVPVEFARYLEERVPGLRQRWAQRIRANGPRQSEAWDRLVEEFVELMTSFLPAVLGPLRDEAENLWVRTAELFGAAGAKRGLAAGEVIEELQVLRELVIRDLYREPPMGGRFPAWPRLLQRTRPSWKTRLRRKPHRSNRRPKLPPTRVSSTAVSPRFARCPASLSSAPSRR